MALWAGDHTCNHTVSTFSIHRDLPAYSPRPIKGLEVAVFSPRESHHDGCLSFARDPTEKLDRARTTHEMSTAIRVTLCIAFGWVYLRVLGGKLERVTMKTLLTHHGGMK